MNAVQRDEMILAAAETFPRLHWRGLRRLCAKHDHLLPAGRWRLRLGADAGWEAPEWEFVPAGRRSGSLVLAWDARAGRRRAPSRSALVRRSLRLARPEPWPRFLRLDVAGAFGAQATVHSMILLGRGVEELGYRGAELWVVVG